MDMLVKALRERIKESEQETAWEKQRYAVRERQLKDPEQIFLLFEATNLTPEDLSRREIECGWRDPANNYQRCSVPATDALPRPAIFVCCAHRKEWNERVAEANAENGGEVHAKRSKVEVE